MKEESYSFIYDLILDEKKIYCDLGFLKKFLKSQLEKSVPNSSEKSGYHIINQKILDLEKSFSHTSQILREVMVKIQNEKQISSLMIVEAIKDILKNSPILKQRQLQIDVSSKEVKAEQSTLLSVVPILKEIVEVLGEYGVESEKERLVRGKKSYVRFTIDLKEENDSIRLLILCDGNGLVPPHLESHGKKLAASLVRASFEGRPGKCSAWIFHIPKSLHSFKILNVFCEDKILGIPLFQVLKTGLVDEEWIRKNKSYYTFNPKNFFFLKSQQKEINSGISGKTWIQVGVGAREEFLLVDEILSTEDIYLKTLSENLNPRNQFLGVALSDRSAALIAEEPKFGPELVLVLNLEKYLYPESGVGHLSVHQNMEHDFS